MVLSLVALGYWQVGNEHLRRLLEELKQVCSFSGTKVRRPHVL